MDGDVALSEPVEEGGARVVLLLPETVGVCVGVALLPLETLGAAAAPGVARTGRAV